MIEKQMEIDALDLSIIQELRHSADRTSQELSQILGKHQSTIRRRIVKLLKSRAIRIIAVPDQSLGPYRTWAFIGINVTPGQWDNIVGALENHDSLYTVARTLGRFDIVAVGYFPSVSELDTFMREVVQNVPGVTRTETLMITQARKFIGLKM